MSIDQAESIRCVDVARGSCLGGEVLSSPGAEVTIWASGLVGGGLGGVAWAKSVREKRNRAKRQKGKARFFMSCAMLRCWH